MGVERGNESVSQHRAPVKARDHASVVRSLRAIGVLPDVERICREEGQPLAAVLTRTKTPELCKARWRAWLWLRDHRGVRADQIAEIWGVAESTVWYGLGRAAGSFRLSVETCRERLERVEAAEQAEALCVELGVELPELMSGSKRPPVVRARRRLWRALVAAGKRAAEIAAAWGMDERAVRLAREAA